MPSQMRTARVARRRSGGVVRTTYAAATPADAITRFAVIRAFSFVIARSAPPRARCSGHRAPRLAAANALRTAVAGAGRAAVARRLTGGAAARRRGRAADGIGGLADVPLRFVGAPRHGVACLVDELTAAIDPLARALGGPAIALGRRIREAVGLLRDLAAQFRPRLRGEPHAEPRAENGSGEQAHHEAAATPAFAVETIVSVCHLVPPHGQQKIGSKVLGF